jgi:signal transduction histidine kinase
MLSGEGSKVASLEAKERLPATAGGSLLLYTQVPLLGSIVIVAIITATSGSSEGLWTVLLIGGAVAVISVLGTVVPRRQPRAWWLLMIAFADVVLITALRTALVREQPNLAILALIPVLWLAYSFGFYSMLCAILSSYFVALFPFILSGWPSDSAEWGSATITPAIVSVIAVAVWTIARQQRKQRSDLLDANEELRLSVASGLLGAEELRVSRSDGLDAASAALAVVNTVDAGIVFYDADGRIRLTNDTAAKLAALAGGAPLADEILAQASRGELVTRRMYRVGTGESKRSVVATSNFVRRESGESLGTVVATHDVTPLAEAIQARDDFMISVSHELRTPLTSIIGYLEIIEDGLDIEASGLATEFGIVSRNSTRLLGLITDLLSDAEQHTPYERRSFDVSDLAQRAVDAIGPAAAAAGVNVRCDNLAKAQAEVNADQIAGVFDKILSNAVKFNQRGGEVSVTVRVTDDDILFRIKDTGSGMTETERAQMFDRFYRSPQARTRAIAGAGLGLSTAKAVVDAHNGTITASSVPGEGTTVRLTLPRRSKTTG